MQRGPLDNGAERMWWGAGVVAILLLLVLIWRLWP
jgi:hypothetical protein